MPMKGKQDRGGGVPLKRMETQGLLNAAAEEQIRVSLGGISGVELSSLVL